MDQMTINSLAQSTSCFEMSIDYQQKSTLRSIIYNNTLKKKKNPTYRSPNIEIF